MAKKSKKSHKSSKSKDSKFFDGIDPLTGYNNLPSGTYEGYIKPGSAVIEDKDDGGQRAVITFVVTSPEEHEDREQVGRYDLTSDVGKGIFLGQLVVLGLDEPSTLKEAASALSETDDIPVRFWVGPEEGEFPPKVRINERLDDSGDNDDGDGDNGEDEESEYTKKDIKKMSDEELDDLAKDNDMDPDEYETYQELREALYEELDL